MRDFFLYVDPGQREQLGVGRPYLECHYVTHEGAIGAQAQGVFETDQ